MMFEGTTLVQDGMSFSQIKQLDMQLLHLHFSIW